MKIVLFIIVIIVIIVFIRRNRKKSYTWNDSSNNVMTLDDRYNASRVETQKEIDRLLEKIHKKGYNSLSKKEKELLNEYSQKI